MFLLGTNVLSELCARKPAQAIQVRAWANSISADHLYLSTATVMELEIGVLAIERRDALQGLVLRAWLRGVMVEFAPRVLPFGTRTALVCAGLHVPNRRPERDAIIAATAKEHSYTLVTRNTKDFAGCGIELLNP